jgi:hypothetical protein
MTLKDLLDLINSSNQAPAEPEPESKKQQERIPIRGIEELVSVQIDESAQESAVLGRRKRSFIQNN